MNKILDNEALDQIFQTARTHNAWLDKPVTDETLRQLFELMLTENPRLFFMHFWANDNALKLAGGLRAALDRVNVVKKG